MRAFFSDRKSISHREKAAVKRFLMAQIFAGLLIYSMSLMLIGINFAQSVMLGIVVTIVPNFFLVLFMFSRLKTQTSKAVRRTCLVGEYLKILLIALLVIVILHRFQVALLPFLLGFLGTYGVYWFAPMILGQTMKDMK